MWVHCLKEFWSSVCLWYTLTVYQWEDGPGSSQQGIIWDRIDHLCSQDTVLAYVQFAVQQDFQTEQESCSLGGVTAGSSSFPGVHICIFPLLNFWNLLLSHSATLLRSLWVVALPLSGLTDSTPHPSLVSRERAPHHLLQVIHKDVKQDRSQYRPGGNPLATSFQVQNNPVTTTAWAWSPNHFFYFWSI